MSKNILGVRLRTCFGIIIFFHVFYGTVVFFFRGDIISHVQILLEYLHQGNFPLSRTIYNSLVFSLAESISLITNLFPFSDMKVTELGMFFKNERPYTLITFINYVYASIFVLSIATTYKFLITRKIILKLAGSEVIPGYFNLIVFLLLFIHPVALFWKGAMYFGYLPYNSFHNSTLILLMPIALWIYYLTIDWFNIKTNPIKSAFQLVVYNTISIFIKPSYFFVYAFVLPSISIIKYRLTRKFFVSCLIILFSSIALIFLYYLVYIFDDNPINKSSSVSIMPFAVWDLYSNNKVLYSVLSYIFPLTFLILLFNRLVKEKMFLFVIFSVIISIFIYIVLAEDGPRFTHSNFSWQILVSNYILFITFFSYWLKYRKIIKQEFNLLIIFTLSLHIFSGLVYFIRMLFLQTLS